ncbi:MAG: EamA family transporter [Phenylobacterium sp.]|uniref:EamA family transporter n=1 Tax=Phenylobacterium sp. TaxID=1871053 RepID=UPI0027363932|nr:EamA family transporter [Phenylobacterium sp.]MDP3749180.1 EamA family transporter [Phenylobacterium sp.]
MNRKEWPAGVVLPLLATVAAMAAFQVGAAFAKSLFPAIGPEGAATLRLGLGAVMLLAIARPWRAWPASAPLLPLLGLGVSVAVVILAFYMAIERLPLGLAIALQFLGPLGVAVFGSRRWSDLAWAILAAAGVWLLVGMGAPGAALDLVGIGWALVAAAAWATYILCGRVASVAFGRSTAALSVAIAALLVLPVGVHEAGAELLSPALIPMALLVALMSTAVPFSLELYAMPRMPARTFAVFTSLEPAFGVLSGLFLLQERLDVAQIGGVTAVVAAAAGAAWSSAGHSAVAEAPPT